jgi:vancomycin resistance protein YoaR
MKLLEVLGIQKKAEPPKSKLIGILTIFFVVLVLAAFVVTPIAVYEFLYQNKIYSGVFVDGISIGGLTQEQATTQLNQHLDTLKQNGLVFNFTDKQYKVDLTVISPSDPDLSYQILDFPIDKMVSVAYNYGRSMNLLVNLNEQLSAILSQKKIPLDYSLDEAGLKSVLKQKFGEFEKPPQDARIVFGDNNEIKIEPETNGYVIDYDAAILRLKNGINLVAINGIELKTIDSAASVTKSQAETLLPLVADILKIDKFTLKYDDKTWEVSNQEFKNWLQFKEESEGGISLKFSDDLLGQKLQAITQEISIAPQDAKFTFADGKVTEFQPSRNGFTLDVAQTEANINQDFLVDKKQEIDLIGKEAEPQIKTADVNTLGIKELIGVGVSDFSGSHVNRIKNIKNAVQHLNGLLIPPGEFSIVDAIGDVTAATGYFPEFVIKGDRTIPEYGGGLCQIGTTVFRAALYSGLPITERRPHSYIVSYYKPLGMDATIYGPHPDLRFINDTGNNILLQIKIEGTKLSFEFWGTSDGRKVEITDPQLYNWTAIPADRLIENPALKPGVKNKLETGRRGADASFTRAIIKPDGTKTEETFRSHYVPWPNIYEIGVQPKVDVQPSADTLPTTSSDSASAGQSGSTTNQNVNGN